MSSQAFAEASFLALPVILAGAVHIAVIKARLFAPLAHLPLDAGLRVRGRRVLGENKSLRGVVVMLGATLSFGWLAGRLPEVWPALAGLGSAQAAAAHPVGWGAALGLGYLAGELPNSFVKRQLGVAPGARAAGAWAPVFWLADQLDSLVGVLVATRLMWRWDFAVALVLVTITLAIHPTAAFAMVRLGLKDRVG